MIADISSWVMSIAGVICISVLVELFMPDGQMNRYIKNVFSFIIVLVIIMPLPKLLQKDYDYDNIFGVEDNVTVDEDYIYQLNFDKLNLIKANIESEILKNGYKNVNVYLNASIFDTNLKIKSISVDLESLVISQNAEHNDISKIRKHISQIIQKYVDIDEEVILYNV